MASRLFLFRGQTFLARTDNTFRAVFLLACLVGVYLFVTSLLMLTELGAGFRSWERALGRRRPETGVRPPAVRSRSGNEPTELAGSPRLRTILLWNAFFSSRDYHFGVGRAPFVEHRCPVDACTVTLDREEAGSADAVVMHLPRVDWLPSRRPPGQKYVFVQREPHYPGSRLVLGRFHDTFNLTMTYRYDSDIPIPYGKVVNRTDQSRPYSAYSPDQKSGLVVWVVSHCNSLGRRELYVNELMKYIRVDVYGHCGNLTCDKSDVYGCMHKLERQYRFYLAFENTYCLDYASEKLYRSLLYDMVPIVYGRVNYTAVSPDHSVIDILDFPNPRLLADYLHYLVDNPDLYARYFDWKKRFDIVQSRTEIFAHAFCRLCEILHDGNYPYRDYRNISAWWLDGTCELGFMMRFRKNHHW